MAGRASGRRGRCRAGPRQDLLEPEVSLARFSRSKVWRPSDNKRPLGVLITDDVELAGLGLGGTPDVELSGPGRCSSPTDRLEPPFWMNSLRKAAHSTVRIFTTIPICRRRRWMISAVRCRIRCPVGEDGELKGTAVLSEDPSAFGASRLRPEGLGPGRIVGNWARRDCNTGAGL